MSYNKQVDDGEKLPLAHFFGLVVTILGSHGFASHSKSLSLQLQWGDDRLVLRVTLETINWACHYCPHTRIHTQRHTHRWCTDSTPTFLNIFGCILQTKKNVKMQHHIWFPIYRSGEILHAVLAYWGCNGRQHDAMVACCTLHGGTILTIFSPKMNKVRECVSMLEGAHAVLNEIRAIRAALH